MSDAPDYILLTVPRREGPARVLVSRGLIERAAWLRDSLRRIIRAFEGAWPESVVLVEECGNEAPPGRELVLTVPEEFFARGEAMRARRVLWWLFDRPFRIEECELTRVLYRQLLASSSETEAGLHPRDILGWVMFGPQSSRFGRSSRFLLLATVLAPPTLAYYLWLRGRVTFRPRHLGALRDLAAFQYFYSLQKGLARTQARLAAAGDLAATLEEYRR